MKSKIEDLAGKAVIVTVFLYLVFVQAVSIVRFIRFAEKDNFWILTVLSSTFSLVFLAFVVALTVLRLPPKSSASGLEPRVTAIAGTFCLMALVVLPTGAPGVELRLISTILIIVGTALSIACIVWLGKSFSIMATARQLVVAGPYSAMRHPLYAAEAVAVIGVVMSHWSIAALALGVVQFALQYRRILNEERVLRDVFPEYEAYAQRVPMLIPRFPGRGS
jgi:protein-S-isoprenylcysteine O-methyltransferase Ste14